VLTDVGQEQQAAVEETVPALSTTNRMSMSHSCPDVGVEQGPELSHPLRQPSDRRMDRRAPVAGECCGTSSRSLPPSSSFLAPFPTREVFTRTAANQRTTEFAE
jgi:hypothetical protein